MKIAINIGVPIGVGGGVLGAVSLLSASITSDGLFLRLTFSRSVTLRDSISTVILTGNLGTYVGAAFDNPDPSAVWDVSFNATIYSDDDFTVSIGPEQFEDSSGNFLNELANFPVTNGSTIAYPAGALFVAIASPLYTASDASHLVPCVDGAAIRWWKNAVSGVWYEQATSGQRFILRANGEGKWYAEGGGTRKHSFAVPTMPGSVGMVCSRFAGQTTGVTWVPVSLNASELARFSGDGNAYARNFRVTRADAFFAAPNDTGPHTYTQVSGADYRAFLDGALKATTAADWAAPNQMLIGASDSSGSQNIAAVAIFPDGSNRAEAEAWIARFA